MCCALHNACVSIQWSYSREKPDSGSLLDIAWSADSTQLAAAGANGAVVFGLLCGRRLEWSNYEATLVESDKVLVPPEEAKCSHCHLWPLKIHILDVSNDFLEPLDFRDPVIKMRMAFGHMVVATATQVWKASLCARA